MVLGRDISRVGLNATLGDDGIQIQEKFLDTVYEKRPPRVSIQMNGGIIPDSDKTIDVVLLRGVVPDWNWALQVFCHNGWEVELAAAPTTVDFVREWAERRVPGLVNRVRVLGGGDEEGVDLFINNRSDYWVGREINWVELMERLNCNGLLPLGLLPREKNMTHLYEDVNFCDYLSDVRADVRCGCETADVIQKIQTYAFSAIEAESEDQDRVRKAMMGGKLLHHVLALLLKQKLDPLGCLLLAQRQDEDL